MLYLTRRQADELVRHAKEGSPDEICGILAGPAQGPEQKVRVERIYRMANAERSAITFLMDPKEQLKVMKEMRNAGLKMVGIYHSHPQTPARPSPRDTELAYDPEVSYVIVSLQQKDKPAIRSFKIADGKVTEEEVRIG